MVASDLNGHVHIDQTNKEKYPWGYTPIRYNTLGKFLQRWLNEHGIRS